MSRTEWHEYHFPPGLPVNRRSPLEQDQPLSYVSAHLPSFPLQDINRLSRQVSLAQLQWQQPHPRFTTINFPVSSAGAAQAVVPRCNVSFIYPLPVLILFQSSLIYCTFCSCKCIMIHHRSHRIQWRFTDSEAPHWDWTSCNRPHHQT
jgi:hypothetical protein